AARMEGRRRVRGDRAEPEQGVDGEHVGGELADGEEGTADRKRMDDRVDAGAVGQAGVDHRCRLVDAPPDLGDDLVDDAAHVRLVDERGVGVDGLAVTLDVEPVWSVDLPHGYYGVVQLAG